jgi:hypothetical protein
MPEKIPLTQDSARPRFETSEGESDRERRLTAAKVACTGQLGSNVELGDRFISIITPAARNLKTLFMKFAHCRGRGHFWPVAVFRS